MKKIILPILILVIVILILAWWNPFTWSYKSAPVSAPISTPVATTTSSSLPMQATSTVSTPSSTITVKLGQEIAILGVKAQVTQVVEDSRCAQGNECLVAGTVRVNAHGSYGPLSRDVTLALGVPYTVDGYTITLASVAPGKIKGVEINPQDYIFTFSLEKSV